MLFPLSWLKEFIDLPEKSEDIARIFNEIGLEVDACEKAELDFSGVIVGKVASASKHPEADSLKITTIFDGKEEHQVICGDPSCHEGQIVAFATIGAVLGASSEKPFKIKKAKLRGVESFGMLCSEEELGLAESSDGILSLPQDLSLGTQLESLFEDTIFEISITPNLAHCFSLIGIARELSAYLKRPLKEIKASSLEYVQDKASPISVVLEDTQNCPLYTGTYIEGIKVQPSPLWLKRKLLACGMRPINNIVDATNACMIAYGQPLHAFDADKIPGSKITVRSSKKGEVCKTLDGEERKLPENLLVITDQNGPNAIAGVMGGEDSEVTDASTNIFLESAHFSPKAVRKGSSKLGISTESSKRFERGVDPKLPPYAASLASDLIVQLAGGRATTPLICGSVETEKKTITCSIDKIHTLIGFEIPKKEILSILTHLQCEVEESDGIITLTPPSYRFDLNIAEDVVEEVARFYGYSCLPRRKAHYQTGDLPHDPMYLFEEQVKSSLLLMSLQELMNIDLISEAEKIPVMACPETTLFPKLSNPSSADQSFLRSSLLGGTLTTLKRNLSFHNTDMHSFEVGKVYYQKDNDPGVVEKTHVSLLLSGLKHPSYWGEEKPRHWSFFDLKGMLESFLSSLKITDVTYHASEEEAFHPGQCATLRSGDTTFGVMGMLHPKLLHRFDLPKEIFYAELNIDALLSFAHKETSFKKIASFPSSDRDWTIPLKKDAEVGTVLAQLRQTQHKLLESVDLLSIYEDERLGDKKNVSFRFTYRDSKKTLSLEAVEKTHEYVVKQSEKALSSSICT